MVEEILQGGVANAGAVTRLGPHVLRPSNPYTPAVHRFLAGLRGAGFDGASLPVGVDRDGRERLEFIPGDVPIVPYPEWAQADEALTSAATLIKRFHAASAVASPCHGDADPARWSEEWNLEMADPAPGADGALATPATPIVCHNDVCLENIVFRDGIAVALLDFDFAAPGRPVYDLVQFARMCVPVDDPVSATALGWSAGADRLARLRLVTDSYGLDAGGRKELLSVLSMTIDRGGDFVRRRVEAGDVNFTRMWNEIGGMERFDRRRRWWAEHRAAFAAALS